MARKRAIKSAERSVGRLGKLFTSLGGAAHPRGAIWSAYRNAHRALRDVIRRNALREVEEVLRYLEADISPVVRESLAKAANIGSDTAVAQLQQYGVPPVLEDVDSAMIADAWMNALRDQTQRTKALLLAEGDPILIIGDDKRQGIVRPAPVVQQGTRWLAMLAGLTWSKHVMVSSKRAGVPFNRQAIAAIDERTTNCCLTVHGQVVGMEELFHLTGTPRFADRMKDPPFHYNCRTSQVLVRPEEADDELTRAMHEAASLEESRRIKEETPGVGPVSALGRQ